MTAVTGRMGDAITPLPSDPDTHVHRYRSGSLGDRSSALADREPLINTVGGVVPTYNPT